MKTQLVLTLVGAFVAGVVLILRPRARKFGVLVLTLVLAVAGWRAVHDATIREQYGRAAPGSPRAITIREIGPPDKSTTGSVDFWDNPDPRSTCHATDWYIATFTVDMYSFCYSKAGLLVSKYNWSSY